MSSGRPVQELRAAAATLVLILLTSAAGAQDQTPSAPAPETAPAPEVKPVPASPPVSGTPPQNLQLIYHGEATSILGKKVQGAAGEDMGRVVDILVDADGQPRAAVIDFGGFLGVGSRKIAVDWNALHFPAPAKTDPAQITLEL
ncbi:MAG TPA: PRC-barrel domain-containing protein, partial [Stellaceae bacterium]|nr:PRC-barrel domain-containing protein [Stellaceae bacterium]